MLAQCYSCVRARDHRDRALLFESRPVEFVVVIEFAWRAAERRRWIHLIGKERYASWLISGPVAAAAAAVPLRLALLLSPPRPPPLPLEEMDPASMGPPTKRELEQAAAHRAPSPPGCVESIVCAKCPTAGQWAQQGQRQQASRRRRRRH